MRPTANIFSDVGWDVRWVGNEDGHAAETSWATFTPLPAEGKNVAVPGQSNYPQNPVGTRNGIFWMPAECDVPLRKGWFYYPAERPKTPAALFGLYLKSVGRSAGLDLGLAPDTCGQLHAADVAALQGFGALVQRTFARNLASKARIVASNTRGPSYAAPALLGGNGQTYRATADAVTTARLTLELPGPQTFDLISRQEYIPLGQRIEAFGLEAWDGTGWQKICAGTSVGAERFIPLAAPVTATKLRLNLTQAPVCLTLSEFALYKRAEQGLCAAGPPPGGAGVRRGPKPAGIYFRRMKRSFWFGLGAWALVGPLRAQSLAGSWQGVETDTHRRGARWPTELRVQKSLGDGLFGVLYQEEGGNPGASVTFQMRGARAATGNGMRLAHGRKLSETGRSFLSYWCYGTITFTYDESAEKLTGRATYEPIGNCNTGTYTFYRIRLKSAATVRAGALSTVRVSGRNVQWFADADLRQPLATGNTYRVKLSKTTTFYLKQEYYPTEQSAVVPITVEVTGAKAAPPTGAPLPPAAAVPTPALPPSALPDTLRPAPAVPTAPVPPAPVVLPTVLFQVGKARLLPPARPALDQLAADLKAQPARRVRVLGHTDRVGEPNKNQVLSEQRATAVKDYLVRAGVAAGRIATAGYGDTRPLFPSPDARNRRVEVEEVP